MIKIRQDSLPLSRPRSEPTKNVGTSIDIVLSAFFYLKLFIVVCALTFELSILKYSIKLCLLLIVNCDNSIMYVTFTIQTNYIILNSFYGSRHHDTDRKKIRQFKVENAFFFFTFMFILIALAVVGVFQSEFAF